MAGCGELVGRFERYAQALRVSSGRKSMARSQIPLEKKERPGTRSRRRSQMEPDMAHLSDPVKPAREEQCG